MHDVLNHVMKRLGKLRVGSAIKDFLSFSARHDKTAYFQKPQMVRYCRTAHVHQSSDVDDAFFGVTKQKKDAAAARVAQLLEDLRDRLEGGRRRHLRSRSAAGTAMLVRKYG